MQGENIAQNICDCADKILPLHKKLDIVQWNLPQVSINI